ncbi:mucin-2-like isoform X1 [Ostrinia nubilalis]|uniref:mucin-2-like isoform X1 n=1 Tax=Ostrinia nubilalis TaxID=29057 RepID=UPI0030826128
MDPVGPWSAYASYNRLAGVQAGAASGDFHHHLASGGSGLGSQSVPSTTSQLLLQAAHTTASLAGQLGSSTASPFNPGGFLSPPAVGYDAVFSPLFHHANPKPAHYSSSLQAQHRQVIAQAAAASKQSSVETELSSLRENYSHQTLAAQGTSFFDQPSTPGSTAGLSWQGNNQLPSPFGILPHESVVPSSPSPATTKASSYENFNFAAAQTLNNHLNSQISSAAKQSNRSGSPATASKQPASSTSSSTFFQSPSSFGNQTDNSYSTSSAKSGQLSSQQDYAGSKSYSSSASTTAHSQQSCIVSTPPVTSSSTPPSKDYRPSSSITSRPSSSIYNSQSPKSTSSDKTTRPPTSSTSTSSFVSPTSKPPQVQTKAQSKIYPELSNDQRKSCESNDKLQPQSSPISYSIMDAPGRLSYSSGSSSKSNRIGSSQYTTQGSSFRHYQSGNNVETDYHVRAKSSSSTDTGYSSSSSQNGPDCGVVVARRNSPSQAPAQTSPLGHGSSPAYPMYHSPMNSINSPQQHGDHYNKANSTAPRSPLDASVTRPPSQNSQVAYPSVITRALGIEQSKNYSENRYERNQTQSSNSSCWENDRQSSRKYTSNSSTNSYNNGTSLPENTHAEEPAPQSQSSTHRLNLTDKPHTYFDANNVALQDLSSCRGDPMTIVKNLQSLQQSCQLQEAKTTKSQNPTTPSSSKSIPRRKSTEKPVSHSNMNEISNAVMADYLANRIPPPAHSSTSNQQQNGSYFDFERWNLPPPPPKMFPGTSAFGSQASLHATNFANQHQLAMPHGHALTYFPPFHLGPHPDFQSSVELTPLSSFSETPPSASSSSFSTPETREEEQPKVVVPNIEEELGFLAEQRANTASSVAPTSQQPNINSTSQDTTSKIMEKKFNVPVTGPGSGFMASYLKFLQGERDTSPPPAGRGARKSTWSRTNTNSNTNNKPYSQNDHNKCDSQQSSNGAMGSPNVLNSGMPLSNPMSSNMSSAGLLGANQLHGAANLLGSQSKGVELDDPRYYNLNKDRKRKYDGSDESAYDAEEEARRLNKPVLNVPSTPLNDKGKKGRTTMNKPTPSAVVAPQPAAPKKPRPPAPPPVASLQAAPQQQYYYQHQPDEVSAHAASLGYGIYGTDNENASRKLQHIKSHQQISNAGQIDNNRPIEEMPYQSGEFVAIKSELNEMWPAIWRVDGKTLLQKYEPFEENGKVLYRNISTYAAWNPENKKLYTQVPVKVRTQSHLETIVELVRSELPFDDCSFIEKRMLETQMYQENFEVYIQTLISHALDPNFLTEIFQEQDEYFLSNVKTVDEVTETMRARVSCSAGGATAAGGGARSLDAAVGTWPGLSVAAGAGVCRACSRAAVARLLLYGQPYNPATLEPVQPDARLAYEKEFLVCASCCGRVQLYSRISHQKYLMYAECSKRVAEKRMQNPSKDTTVILNELLADEVWLSQLFRDVRHAWAEAEAWERKLRQVLGRHM